MSYFLEWKINWKIFSDPEQTKIRILEWLRKNFNIVEKDNKLYCFDEKDPITPLWVAETKLEQDRLFRPSIVKMIYREANGYSEKII